MKKDTVLESKGDYNLQVGISSVDDELCYQLVNYVTGVIEVETRILPQAYKFLEDLSSSLDMNRDLKKEDNNVSEKNVVNMVRKGDI